MYTFEHPWIRVYLRVKKNFEGCPKYKDNLINKNIDKEEKGIFDPNLLVGFVEGEGCFFWLILNNQRQSL